MLNINDDTVLVGSTELRGNMPKLAKEIKTKKVIVVKRGKPFAVLSDFDDYQEKEEMLDTFEDIVLGYLAKERDEKSDEGDFVDHETATKDV